MYKYIFSNESTHSQVYQVPFLPTDSVLTLVDKRVCVLPECMKSVATVNEMKNNGQNAVLCTFCKVITSRSASSLLYIKCKL